MGFPEGGFSPGPGGGPFGQVNDRVAFESTRVGTGGGGSKKDGGRPPSSNGGCVASIAMIAPMVFFGWLGFQLLDTGVVVSLACWIVGPVLAIVIYESAFR